MSMWQYSLFQSMQLLWSMLASLFLEHGEDRAVIHQHPLSSLSPDGVEPWQIQGREDRNPVLEEEQHEYVSPKRSGPYRGCMVILSCCAQWLCLPT